MEFNLKKDELSKNKKLKKKIINEYLYVIFTILILNILLPFLADYMIGDNIGIDGIGQVLGIIVILRILKYIITFIFFVINPIRILFSYKNDFREILPKIKKSYIHNCNYTSYIIFIINNIGSTYIKYGL